MRTRKVARVSKSKLYYYKDKGVLKPVYVHKYEKDFGITGRKSYSIHRTSKDPKSKIVYKFKTKKQWKK